MLNLITDSCFPVQRLDGTVENIAIWQLTDHLEDNPITAFRAPRADLNGALVQFAIGLLQTAFMPESHLIWRNHFRNPPSSDDLKKEFQPLATFFNLMGDGPRFMQDLLLKGNTPPNSIDKLFIDAPGGNTLKKNTDHFIKRGNIKRLSPMSTAMALFCLQNAAPSGGVGHRTSLRGGGPLTTLIRREKLWETLWLAVLDKPRFMGDNTRWDNHKPEDCFPWLTPTMTSEKNGVVISPETHHPLTVYWAMPRRIRLAEPITQNGICDLSGQEGNCFFTNYEAKNYGNNYEGWVHPLTPHYQDKKGGLLPVHGQPGGLAYQNWLGLAFRETGKSTRQPAAIIRAYGSRRVPPEQKEKSGGRMPRIWVFGYDMDNAKARSWIDRTMPVIFAGGGEEDNSEHRKEYEAAVKDLIQAARYASGILLQQYKAAIVRKGVTIKGDLSFINARFWELTEPGFLNLAESLADDPEDAVARKEQWLKDLRNAALALFDKLTEVRSIEIGNPERPITARNNLGKYTWYEGKKFREQAGLQPLPKKTAKAGGKS